MVLYQFLILPVPYALLFPVPYLFETVTVIEYSIQFPVSS